MCFADDVRSKHERLEEVFQIRSQIVMNKLKKCIDLSMRCFSNYVSLLVASKLKKSAETEVKPKKRKKGKANEDEEDKRAKLAKRIRAFVNFHDDHFERIVEFFMRKLADHGNLKKLNIKATKLMLRSNLEFIAVLKILLKAKIQEFENMLNGHLKSKEQQMSGDFDTARQLVEEMQKRFNILNSFVFPIQKRGDWETRQKKKREEKQRMAEERKKKEEKRAEEARKKKEQPRPETRKAKADDKIQSLLDSIKEKKEPRRRFKAKLKDLEQGPVKHAKKDDLGLSLIDKFSKYMYEDEYDDTLEAPVKMKFHIKGLIDDRNRKKKIQEQKKKMDRIERQRKMMEELNENKSSSGEDNEDDDLIEDAEQLTQYDQQWEPQNRPKKPKFEGYQEVSKGRSKRAKRKMRGRDIHNRQMLKNKNYWKMEQVEEEEEEELVYYVKKGKNEYQRGEPREAREEAAEGDETGDTPKGIQARQSEAKYNTKKTQSDRHRDMKKRYNKKDYHNKNKRKKQNRQNEGDYVRRDGDDRNRDNGGSQRNNNQGRQRGRGRGGGRKRRNRRKNYDY